MSTPDPRLSRRDAERLLDAPAEHDNLLGWALTAAGAPAHAEELRREDATVAAFHAARVSPAPASRTGYVSPSRLGGRAATRAVVATGAVVALMSGGFAVASSADLPGVPDLPGLPGLPDLPGLPGQADDRATESVAEAPRGAAGSATSGTSATSGGGDHSGTSSSGSATSPGPSDPSGTSNPSSADPSATGTDGPSPTRTSPVPQLEGLCRAFQATDRADAGGSLDSAAFQVLATEAGGPDRIATYCIDLIGPPKQTGKPTDTATPTTRPSPTSPTPTKPTPTKPTPSPGKPTDKPTPSPGRPTDQPTPSPGKPSDLPTPDGAGGPDKPDNPGKGGGKQSSG